MAIRHRNGKYLWQRLGFYRGGTKADIWLHAASVGEALALLPLVEALQQHYPHKKILFSSFTPTGGVMARQKLPSTVQQVYLPLDLAFSVKRFLKCHQPRLALIMETELWPELFVQCRQQNIPLLMINGRLSVKTMRSGSWLQQLSACTIQSLQAIFTRSELDQQRFVQLGANPQNTQMIGNIKFAALPQADTSAIELDRPYVLLASSHEDEELQIARAWLAAAIDTHLLVIIPRHPVRKKSIQEQLKPLTEQLATRSEGEAVSADTAIYLADTFGELPGFIAGSTLTIMGGSFITTVGGHNILEVGALGKALLFGPHMHNFRDESELFLANHAALQVATVEELIEQVKTLIHDPQRLHQLGENAQQTLLQQADVLDAYLQALRPYLDS